MQAAQYIVRHYNSSLPASPVLYRSMSTGNSSSRVLRVLFISRSPKVAVRQILNMDELLERCQAWKYTDPASSIQFAAECGVWQPGSDLQSTIAAVRSADIMVGRHGAGMTNGFFMKDGAASEWCCLRRHGVTSISICFMSCHAFASEFVAVVDVFGAGWTWQLFRDWRDQDERSMVQWWGLTVEVRTWSARHAHTLQALQWNLFKSITLWIVTCAGPYPAEPWTI
jgi:hypothetical protein